MFAAGCLITTLVVGTAFMGVAADGPYHYGVPGGIPSPSPSPVQINNAILSGASGYVSPSQLVATTPASLVNNYDGYNGYQDPDVTRHVYVHVAPEDPADSQQPTVVQAPIKPKKHYKIVFIKTPTLLPAQGAQVNLPPADQEKTLIYVLSKKPDLQKSVVLNTPAPTQPAKPEVYFIRYKTNEVQYPASGVTSGNGGAGRPLTNSYGVPLGQPLGPNSLYAKSTLGSYNTL